MSKAGERILASVRKARAYVRGEPSEEFVAHVHGDVDVRAIGEQLDITRGPASQGRLSITAARPREHH